MKVRRRPSAKQNGSAPIPNPGSADAVRRGCCCPVYDNERGAGVPDGKGGTLYWRTQGCPLHTRGRPQ